ncbi:tail fiber protein [Puniceispirillum phage HMO-2011]|uniref:tail fiber protein n=1 Tax=Puniceispirillum phage HMO-2011 TaxID=948071 RepID=UPI000351BA97|nr:tail fiber protein [Puniceispirillum phage HMO-2011]ADW08418.1 putative tail fiber protein [Puniceispirillum phage HMO-2011]
MSTLKADTIQSTGGGAATLTKQSAAKVWGNLDGTGTIAIRDSFNVSSADDNGTGIYDFNYSNSMSNDDYAPNESVSETSGFEGNLNRYPAIDGVSTSDIRFGATFSGSNYDVDELYVTVNGDLA